jgi:hypothetical protein
MSNLIDFIFKNVDFQAYYKLYFPKWDGNHNTNVTCPWATNHEKGTDKRASFSLNINATGGCFCQSCGKRVGSIIHFEKEITSTEDDEAAATSIYSKFFRPILSTPGKVEEKLHPFKVGLKGSPKVFVSLQNEIGISNATIERFNLGWDAKVRRVTIPILDGFGQLLNIRYYRLPSMRENENFPKFLNHLENKDKDNEVGYGSPASIFPHNPLFSLCRSKHKPEVVFWMTGERDTLKGWDDGIPSFCYTTGESACKKEWALELKKLNVSIGIVQDNDKAGKEGAKKRLDLLEAEGIPAFIIEMEGEGIKDYSDYRREGGTAKEFVEFAIQLSKEAPGKENGEETESEIEEEYHSFAKVFDPTKIENQGIFNVSDISSNTKLLNKPIKVKAIVSGVMPRSFSIPHVFEIGGKLYRLCVSREMLELIGAPDKDIIRAVHVWLNTKAHVKFIEHLTITEVEIIPMVQPGIEIIYKNQKCYFIGQHIECNKPYLMTVIPTSEMSSQESVGMITEIEPVSNILDSYKFDDESYRKLSSEFQIDDKTKVIDGLRLLAHSISTHYSGIHNRDDVHIAALLSWIAPLRFEFPFEGMQRGWLNTLILGDTETGKSKVCQKLTDLFHCGVFISSESCSYVGLVGGAVKSSSGMFLLRWGKIPLYNRQLVVMEELSGLTTEEISWMSDIRSSGIARYDKAGLTGATAAQTRLICLSNVRGKGRSLSDYNTGVQAAQDLVGHNEDLARFDLLLTVTDDEVDGKVINSDRSTEERKLFSSVELEAFKELVMFAWSLKPEQIDFTLDAYRACLTYTLKMCSVYHPSLPIFKSGSGRLKLARVALAIACIQFAWDNDKKRLVVTEKHVEGAADLLNRFYKKPSFGYARYSKVQYDLQKVTNESEVIAKIKEVFKDKISDFLLYISHTVEFTKQEINESMGVHVMYAERIISTMFLSNLLKKGEGYNKWALSTAGRKWVERKLSELQH